VGTDSGIPYVHHTWGPWRGCTKVSAGCENCYMFREQTRYKNDPTKVVRCSKGNWRQPYAGGVKAWKKGDRVMVCPWSDFFHPDADDWRKDAWAVMLSRPDIHWIVPTKRTERITECLEPTWVAGFRVESLTILASCENQAMADRRGTELRVALGEVYSSYPRFHAGISVEPMLESVKLGGLEDIEWVIVGAESAPRHKVRHCASHKIVWLYEDCMAATVPVYVKQIHDSRGRLVKMPKGWPRQYPGYMGVGK